MVCVLFLSFLLGGELKLDLCSNNLELLCVLLLDTCSCCLLSKVLFGKYSLAWDSWDHECYMTSVILYLLFNFILPPLHLFSCIKWWTEKRDTKWEQQIRAESQPLRWPRHHLCLKLRIQLQGLFRQLHEPHSSYIHLQSSTKNWIIRSSDIGNRISWPRLCCSGLWTVRRCSVPLPAGTWGLHTGWWSGRTGGTSGQRLNIVCFTA